VPTIVSVTFGAKYLTDMVTSVPPYETFSLIKNNILHQSKNYKKSLRKFKFHFLIDLKTRAVAPFFPDTRTFHNIYKLQKHVLLRHQSMQFFSYFL
jgi:hypothetical protein